MRGVLTEILHEEPLVNLVLPWMEADSVTLMTVQLRRGTEFSLFERSVRVEHYNGGFVAYSNCEHNPRVKLPFSSTGGVEQEQEPPSCWKQSLIFVSLLPDPDGTFQGWFSGRDWPTPSDDSVRFRVYPHLGG